MEEIIQQVGVIPGEQHSLPVPNLLTVLERVTPLRPKESRPWLASHT